MTVWFFSIFYKKIFILRKKLAHFRPFVQLFAVSEAFFLPKFLHIPVFLCNNRLKFCFEPRFCKHAKFSKVNAAEKFGVDFFSPLARFFAHFERNRL